MSFSRWRQAANEVIERVLAELPAEATDQDKANALSRAYPFGAKEHHPYKIWRDAVRRAIGVRKWKLKPELSVPSSKPESRLEALVFAVAANLADQGAYAQLVDYLLETGVWSEPPQVIVADVVSELWLMRYGRRPFYFDIRSHIYGDLLNHVKAIVESRAFLRPDAEDREAIQRAKSRVAIAAAGYAVVKGNLVRVEKKTVG